MRTIISATTCSENNAKEVFQPHAEKSDLIGLVDLFDFLFAGCDIVKEQLKNIPVFDILHAIKANLSTCPKTIEAMCCHIICDRSDSTPDEIDDAISILNQQKIKNLH